MQMTNPAYYVATTRLHVTREQARQIDSAVKAIDPRAEFVRHYSSGNPLHGWIEMPNDGQAETNDRKLNARKMRDAMLAILHDLSSRCICYRTYDSSAGTMGARWPSSIDTAEFWRGQTYACHSGCDGFISVLDSAGHVNHFTNAAFATIFRHA